MQLHSRGIAFLVPLVVAGTLSLVGAAAVFVKSKSPTPDNLPREPLQVEIEHQFARGTFPESIAFDSAGTVYVSLISTQGDPSLARVWSREINGTEFTFEGTGFGLALDHQGRMLSTVLEGNPEQPENVVVRLQVLEGKKARTLFSFPKGALVNGIAVTDTGEIFGADSSQGILWRGKEGEMPQKWLEDARLAPSSLPGIPGANGLRFFKGALYVSNSSTRSIWKSVLTNDGLPGPLLPVTQGITGDGFAIAPDGTLYVTTHAYNSLVRVDPNGRRVVVADSNEGLVGASDAAFAPPGFSANKDLNLFVVQDGGSFVDLVPAVVRWIFPSDRGTAALLKIGNPGGKARREAPAQ